jgi:hypothetical protein
MAPISGSHDFIPPLPRSKTVRSDLPPAIIPHLSIPIPSVFPNITIFPFSLSSRNQANTHTHSQHYQKIRKESKNNTSTNGTTTNPSTPTKTPSKNPSNPTGGNKATPGSKRKSNPVTNSANGHDDEEIFTMMDTEY